MKKSLYLAFIGVLALSMGCVVSDYPLITDTQGDSANFVVNTNGSAVMNATGSQVATLWPDANEELYAFIDQGFDGVRSITNHVNRSFGSPTKFLDYTYCNPDFTGCSVFNSTDDGGPLFDDYVVKPNCPGYRSASLIVGYTGRLQECGRSVVGSQIGLEGLATLYNEFVAVGNGTYRIVANRSNLRVQGESPLGSLHTLPIYGAHPIDFTLDKGIAYQVGPAAVPTALAMARLSQDFGVQKWHVTLYGQEITLNVKVLEDQLTSRIRRGL
jgi:hypothetical protein